MQRAPGDGKTAPSHPDGNSIVAFRAARIFAAPLTEAKVNSSHLIAAWFGVSVIAVATSASAQSNTFSTSSAQSNDWSSSASKANRQERANKRNLGLGLSLGALVIGGRWEIANGGLLGLDVVWRRAFQTKDADRQTRIEVGGLGRLGFTPDAVLVGAGVPFRVVLGLDTRWETAVGVELSYTRMAFTEPFFQPRNGFTGTFRWDFGMVVEPAFSIGMTPLGLSVITGDGIRTFVAYEPGVWIRYSPI